MTETQDYENELNQYHESLLERQDKVPKYSFDNPHEYTKSSRSNNRRTNNKKQKRDNFYYN